MYRTIHAANPPGAMRRPWHIQGRQHRENREARRNQKSVSMSQVRIITLLSVAEEIFKMAEVRAEIFLNAYVLILILIS